MPLTRSLALALVCLVTLPLCSQANRPDPKLVAQANAGNADAQHELGTWIRETENNPVEASTWFRKSAEQGQACACYDYGMCFAQGTGEKADFPTAVRWFVKAAAKGHLEAMFNLGVAFHEGMGVSKNLALATQWFQRAAAGGHDRAMLNLGVALESGEGAPRDRAEALTWYERAAKAGLPEGQANADRLRKAGFGPPLPIQENASGIIHGKNHAYMIQAPKGWVLDNAIWADRGIFAVFYPKGLTLTTSPLMAYTMVQDPAPGGLEAHIKADMVHSLKGSQARPIRHAPLTTQDGRTAVVYSLQGVPGQNAEWMAYIEAPTVIILVSVSAPDPKAFPEGEGILKQLVNSITWFTDKVNYQ